MIFVTGGSGLVGAALLKELLRLQIPVRALHHRNTPVILTSEEISRIEWVQGDVLDPVLLESALQGCAQVYHCAAVVSFHPSRKKEMYRLNVEGTANVVNACLTQGIQKLIHVSSVAALGRNRMDQMIDESVQWTSESVNSHYGQSKFLSEMEVWRGIGEGLNAAIVNPSIILGEASWNSGSAALFKKAWDSFSWYTNGGTGFIDVQDVVRAMIMLMNHPVSGERFILSNEQRTYKEILTLIAQSFATRPPYRKAPEWIMELLWRIEAFKSIFSNKEPLLTRETVKTAKVKTFYNTQKFREAFPEMRFTPIDETIRRTSLWLQHYYSLNK
jgi:nucleoside-diphosphate-sugar epimerase